MTKKNTHADNMLRAFLAKGQAAQAAVDEAIRAHTATERCEKKRRPVTPPKRRPA